MDKNCLFCNSDLTGVPKGGYKFCNKQCRIKYHASKRENPANCISCGSRLGKCKQKYCDDTCYRAYNRKSDYETNCLYCGSEIIWNHNTGPKKKYCNKSCRDKFSIAKRKQEGSSVTCGNCGKHLSVLQMGRKQKYCSPECYRKSLRIFKGTKRNCVICGIEFEPHMKHNQCCSTKCAMKKTRKYQIENARKNPLLMDCENCGIPIEYFDYGGSVKTKYCDDCRLSLERDRSRRRRIITRYQALEKIIDVHIYERDNWICQICGEHVNEHIKWPDPMSSSLDHIIPISKGGEHIRSNVQLAHLECNNRKWNRL